MSVATVKVVPHQVWMNVNSPEGGDEPDALQHPERPWVLFPKVCGLEMSRNANRESKSGETHVGWHCKYLGRYLLRQHTNVTNDGRFPGKSEPWIPVFKQTSVILSLTK